MTSRMAEAVMDAMEDLEILPINTSAPTPRLAA